MAIDTIAEISAERNTCVSHTLGPDAAKKAASWATYEITALILRIRAEAMGDNRGGDADITIISHSRRISQLGNALMSWIDGDPDELIAAGCVEDEAAMARLTCAVEPGDGQ